MAGSSRPISNCSACTSPAATDLVAVVGNTAGVANNFKTTVAQLFTNSATDFIVKDGQVLSTNTLILRFSTTPANSTVGGYPNNSIWFDNAYLYVVQANGYIMRTALTSF